MIRDYLIPQYKMSWNDAEKVGNPCIKAFPFRFFSSGTIPYTKKVINKNGIEIDIPERQEDYVT